MSEEQRNRIVAALQAEISPLREEGLALLVDHVLRQKLREAVDLDVARDLVISALTEENLERIVLRHVRPGFERYLAHVAKSPELVGGLVPDPDRIRTIVKKTRLPRAKWAEGMVDPVLMRRLFAPVWANLLMSFSKRLPLPGMGGAGAASDAAKSVGRGVGGIAERLGRSVQERAEKIVDAGRSAMGGLGAELERRLQATAREFSDGAAELFREALSDRLKSTEGQELIAQIAGQIIDHVLMTKLSEIHADAAYLPIAEILATVPELVANATPRDFVREIVNAEVASYLSLEGDRTVQEILTEMKILDSARTAVLAQANRLARTLFETPAFSDWFGRLLDA